MWVLLHNEWLVPKSWDLLNTVEIDTTGVTNGTSPGSSTIRSTESRGSGADGYPAEETEEEEEGRDERETWKGEPTDDEQPTATDTGPAKGDHPSIVRQ